MTIEHLPNTAEPAEVAEALDRNGAVVVDEVVPPDLLDQLACELAPHIGATPDGADPFTGVSTKRTGGLIARSEAARQLVMHPLALGTAGVVLDHATSFQLHLTQIIAIGGGETAQPIHRDQWAFDFYPFPPGPQLQCNTMWALTDFTEANGATRIVPGSHRHEDRLTYEPSDTVPAEMTRGSVLFYVGSLYHGGGANQTDTTRMGANITYVVSWLRQEENQYLSVPTEVARTLDDDLLRLMGYSKGAYALGYVDDLRDPLDVLREQATPGRATFLSTSGRD